MNTELKATKQIEKELLACDNLNQVAKIMGISYYALNQMIGKIGVSKEDYLENIGEMYIEIHGEKHFHPRSIVNGGRLSRELSATFVEVIKKYPLEERGKEFLNAMKEDHGVEIEKPAQVEFDGVVYDSLQDFANRFGLSERELRFITERKGVTDNFQNDLVKYFSGAGKLKFLAYSASKTIGSETINANILVQELFEEGFIEKPSNIQVETYLSAISNANRFGFLDVFKKNTEINLLNMKFDSIQEMLWKFKVDIATFFYVSTQIEKLEHILYLTSPYKILFEANTSYINGKKFNYPVELLPFLSISVENLNDALKQGVQTQDIIARYSLTDSASVKVKDESSELRSQLSDAKGFFTSIGVPFAQALKLSKQSNSSLTEIRELIEGFEIEIEGSKLRTFADISEVLGITFEHYVNAVKEVKEIKDADERCFAFIEKCL